MSLRDEELRREIQTHLELEVEDHVSRGLSEEEARRRAHLAFGGISQTREDVRRVRVPRWLDDLRADVRYALRTLAASPLFTVVSVATLALGIGATTAVFSVVHAVLLKPLAYSRHSDRLVRMMMNVPASASPSGRPVRTFVTLSPTEAMQLQAASRTLSALALAGPEVMSMRGYEGAARMTGARVSASIFALLGSTPAMGRSFIDSDETPGAEPVVLLSHSAWFQYFGGDPEILDRRVVLDSVLGPHREFQCRVIGVMPATFTFPNSRTEFWMPYATAAAGNSRANRGPVLAALRADIAPAAAASELGPLVRAIRNDKVDVTYEVVREADEQVAPVRPALLVLTAAVGFLFLIACVNVANLLLSRAEGRRHEVAIRMALGAGRGRLIKQILVESTILAALGGVIGAALAYFGIQLLRLLVGSTLTRLDIVSAFGFPRFDEIGIDGRVLAFTSVLSVVTGITFGVMPALRQSRTAPLEALRTSTRTTADAPRTLAIRNALVVVQVASALVLLIGGALLARSFVALANVSSGYDPDHLLTFQVNLAPDRYDGERQRAFAEQLVTRLRSVPGAQGAAFANQLPTVGIRDTAGGLWKTYDPNRSAPSGLAADARIVSRDYLATMGVHLVAGRSFTEDDDADGLRVLVVNELLARREFGTDSPIGQHMFIGREAAPWVIVGVVSNVHEFELDRELEPQFFVDIRQWPSSSRLLFPTGAYFVIRLANDPMALVPTVRELIREIDPGATLFHVAPMERLLASTLAMPRTYAVLMSVFATIGLLLAVIGVAGVVAYGVTKRTREIGIRMALGATARSIIGSVLRHSVKLTLVGLAIGLAVAHVLARYLQSLLFGLAPLDPATFVLVPLIFVSTVLLASLFPARRASRIDPLTAIRTE